MARIVIAACVFLGALAIPMGLEILWRFDGTPGSHLQPEVTSVEVGGQDLVKGTDPYLKIHRLHHEVPYHPPGEPDYKGFLPYLPVMAVLGIPSDIWPNSGLSDARIFFCLTTLAVGAVAMYLCRSPGAAKSAPSRHSSSCPWPRCRWPRGGRHPGRRLHAAGHGAGPTAAPLRVRRRARHRVGHEVHRLAARRPGPVLRLGPPRPPAPAVMLAGILVVAVPTIFPFALRGPFALIDDVVLFPLGLSAIPSTAASALPGPRPGDLVPLAQPRRCPSGVGLILGVGLVRHLIEHTPRTVAEVCNISGVVMAVLILLAPNPRVGYLVYPVNLFVWAYLLAEPERRRGGRPTTTARARHRGDAVARPERRQRGHRRDGAIRGRALAAGEW